MGSDAHYPEEKPAHRVSTRPFWIDVHTVTNAEFARFVDATGYVTLAERPANADDYPGALPEMLEPASVVFRQPTSLVDMSNHYNWWAYVRGACWRYPHGPESSITGLEHHPVVQLAYEDAEAYATWIGKSLPTEAEWELAARGGLEGTEYVWGADETGTQGRYLANYWQGEFPYRDSGADGFQGTAPVGSFPPNGFGLHDMAGNVWEWTSDWYQHHARVITSCCSIDDPRGGTRERSVDPSAPVRIPRRVMKGGSYLCARSYCHRYRPAARMAQPIDTATCHLGFRCVVRSP